MYLPFGLPHGSKVLTYKILVALGSVQVCCALRLGQAGAEPGGVQASTARARQDQQSQGQLPDLDIPGFRIRIRMDLHSIFGNWIRIHIRIRLKSWIRIRFKSKFRSFRGSKWSRGVP